MLDWSVNTLDEADLQRQLSLLQAELNKPPRHGEGRRAFESWKEAVQQRVGWIEKLIETLPSRRTGK